VYRITCRNGADEATATTTVNYIPNQPRMDLYVDSTVPKHRDQGFQLTWESNVSPCVASGGYPGDGWAGAKSGNVGFPTITIGQAGTWTYSMTCGSGASERTASLSVVIPPPELTIEPHAAEILMSRGMELRWNGTVGNCVAIGDWTSGIATYFSSGFGIASSTTPGLKTFGVRCGLSNYIEATTQVNFLPVPVVNMTATPASAPVNQSVTLNWSATHVDGCRVQGVGTPEWNGLLPASGSRVVTRSVPGPFGFYLDCGGVVDAVVVQWLGVTTSPSRPAAPAVTFNIDQTTRVAGDAVTLSWTSSRAAACRGSQGVAGDGWVGALPVSGTRSIVVNAAGTHTWEISCEGAPPAASSTVSAVYTARPSSSSSSGGGSSSSSGSGGGGGGGGRIDPLLLGMLGMLLLSWSLRGRRSEQLFAGHD
jgi:hypothetical protein